MNCHEFQRRLASAIEERGPSETERNLLRRHSEQCPHQDCRRLWDDHELLARHVPGWTREVPRIALANRVISSLRRSSHRQSQTPRIPEQQPPRVGAINSPTASASTRPGPSLMAYDRHKGTGRQHRRWLALTATIAPLLLLVPALRLGRIPGPEPVVRSAPTLHTLSDGGRNLVPSAEEPVAVSEMIRTFAGVPQSASRLMSETIVFLDGGIPADQSAAQPAGYSPWQGRLTEQWEPWGRELETAFEAFLRSISQPPPAKSSQFRPTAGQDVSAAA